MSFAWRSKKVNLPASFILGMTLLLPLRGRSMTSMFPLRTRPQLPTAGSRGGSLSRRFCLPFDWLSQRIRSEGALGGFSLSDRRSLFPAEPVISYWKEEKGTVLAAAKQLSSHIAEALACARSTKYCERRFYQNHQVQPWRPGFNVA